MGPAAIQRAHLGCRVCLKRDEVHDVALVHSDVDLRLVGNVGPQLGIADPPPSPPPWSCAKKVGRTFCWSSILPFESAELETSCTSALNCRASGSQFRVADSLWGEKEETLFRTEQLVVADTVAVEHALARQQHLHIRVLDRVS